MDLAEYFTQTEYYFSETAGQLMPLEDMVFSHMANAFAKLISEFGTEFLGTPLCREMQKELRPPLSVLAFELKTSGKASFVLISQEEKKAARSRFYRASKKIGKTVKVTQKGAMMTGEVTEAVNIRVRGREVQ